MERMTVVFFCGREDCYARKRRGRWRWEKSWCYDVRKTEKKARGIWLQGVRVNLPMKEKAGKNWSRERLTSYLEGLEIPPEGRTVYYQPDKAALTLLKRRTEPLSLEWILFFMTYYAWDFDGLLILQDREMAAEELVRHFAPGTKYLGVLTDAPDKWQDLADELAEELGCLLEVNRDWKEQHYGGQKLLVIAGSKGYGVHPSRLPRGCVWFNIDGESDMGKAVCSRAEQVSYVDGKHFFREMFFPEDFA